MFSFKVEWTGQCVVDQWWSRMFIGEYSNSTNTPKLCGERCSDKGYSFAGTQSSNQCWCGDLAPPQEKFAPAAECNSPCSGDNNQMCGGAWRMSVYKTKGKSNMIMPWALN